MFRIIHLLGILILSVSQCSGQKSDIDKLVSVANNFTNDQFSFGLEYVEEKSTFVFTKKKGDELIKIYKLIKSDIHPEGIFTIDKEDGFYLRILSLSNNKVFVSERFINGFRRGNNINFVDIGNLKDVSKKELSEFIELFKKVVSDKSPIDVDKIDVSPPRTKNN